MENDGKKEKRKDGEHDDDECTEDEDEHLL